MRSENICGELTDSHRLGQERFRTKTGLPVSPYFSGTKIMWLLGACFHVFGLYFYTGMLILQISSFFHELVFSFLLFCFFCFFVKANVKDLRQCAEQGNALFGTIDSWLLWKLSNGHLHVTDVTNASRTLLMNIK